MAGIEIWASSIILHELHWLKNFKISTSKESNNKKSVGVALLPFSSLLFDIDHFASYRVNAGH